MIEVKEFEGHKFIRKDGLTQSIIPPIPNGYWRQMIPEGLEPENALILGLGAGTVCVELKEMFPDVKIEAVENSREMVKLAKKQFGIDALVDEIHLVNAFEFVKFCKEKYSLVIVDLYDGFNFDLHVITDVFLDACKELVREGGFLAVNVPNLDQCEHHFNSVKKSETNKIYFFEKKTVYAVRVIT